MPNLEKITDLINTKRSKLGPEIQLIGPVDGITTEIQSQWLIQLLSKMYVQHGISRDPQKLQESIDSGECQCWFAKRGDDLIACAALIKQSDGTFEVGRAVSLESGVGSILMLEAAQHHFETNSTALVAEVRVSDDFKGVPSGEATQKICLGHFGLTPHAFVPAFHHGNPDRQEGFLFASSQKITESKPLHVPKRAVAAMEDTVFPFLQDIGPQTEIKIEPTIGGPKIKDHKWTRVLDFPLNVVVPDELGQSLEKVSRATETEGSPFTLIPIEASPESGGALLESLKEGFIPCGVDRNLGEQGHPIILMGKLRQGTDLAPIKLDQELIPKRIRTTTESIHALIKPKSQTLFKSNSFINGDPEDAIGMVSLHTLTSGAYFD